MGFFSFKRSSQTSTPQNATASKKKNKSRFGVRRGRRRSSSPIRQQLPRTQSPRRHKRSKSLPRHVEIPQPREPSRLGSNFCGYCDMRIAASLLNIVHMVAAIIKELIEASKWGNRNYFKEPPILLILAIVASSIGLNATLRFKRIPLIVSSILLAILCFFYASEMYYVALVIGILLFYAQVVLVDEIKRGIMNKNTYEKEEYIDESGRAVYFSVRDKAIEIGEATAERKNSRKTQDGTQDITQDV